jgi:hypothetical protein
MFYRGDGRRYIDYSTRSAMAPAAFQLQRKAATRQKYKIGRRPTTMTNEARTYGSVLNETARSSSMQGIIGLVLLLGVSYTFNAMDRQVFPALLARILAD